MFSIAINYAKEIKISTRRAIVILKAAISIKWYQIIVYQLDNYKVTTPITTLT